MRGLNVKLKTHFRFSGALDRWPGAALSLARVFLALLIATGAAQGAQQDIIKSGTGIGQAKTRLAVSNFRATPETSELMRTFDEVLWNDLDYAGIFDLVSRSFFPLSMPSNPAEVKAQEWSRPPASAQMLAIGNASTNGQQLFLQGWLIDPANAGEPVVFGKQYQEEATKDGARLAAHKFADDIILRLGGGIPGISQSKILFIRRMSPRVKELWIMDYDGSNQKQITHLNTICLTPALSLDGTQVAFTTLHDNRIVVFSLLTHKPLPFFNRIGLNTTPTWSPDGTKLAFTSSVTSDPEIYVGDSRGQQVKRLTFARGVDISPAWNPKTGNQIAFVSDRSGRPQIYMMDADGANVTQVVRGGSQALDPAWSPNGRLLAFTWDAGGEYDIHLLDVATQQIVQMTKDLRRNEHPSWSPDNRHIVFQSTRTGTAQIWTMLADGTKPRQLTFQGENSEPVWSSK
ncbi:MAG: Tol-Pal system beta propeller repeat protein TolB [Acidobacteria bacterium]|nr:Tol-Pal system beta propeller repeat protein TolB [Acidobacteriota bacterium]